MKYLYGPVKSRRLGYSLGVSLVPHKVCNFDCVYCQLGRTTVHTDRRKEYVKIEEIVAEIREWLERAEDAPQSLDYITISGSGEPLLNAGIGDLIKKIKDLTSVPLALITNSQCMVDKGIRRALKGVDLIVPSLDAVTQEEFEKIDRPAGNIKIYDIIKGLIHMRKEFKGRIWLEIMIVKGINDSTDYIKYFKPVLSRIDPDKIQLNTPVRCPDLRHSAVPDTKALGKIKKMLGSKCEII
ncbi:MAG: radical SAM protein [Candidatus Omnitrophica bacterium]|nr:radical SAM protein [Candidatus Omnitrophota bacterium]